HDRVDASLWVHAFDGDRRFGRQQHRGGSKEHLDLVALVRSRLLDQRLRRWVRDGRVHAPERHAAREPKPNGGETPGRLGAIRTRPEDRLSVAMSPPYRLVAFAWGSGVDQALGSGLPRQA